MARCKCGWSYGRRVSVCRKHKRAGKVAGSSDTFRKSRAKFAVTATAKVGPVEAGTSKSRRTKAKAPKGGDAAGGNI